MTVTTANPSALGMIASGLQARLQVAFPPARFEFDFMPPRVAANGWDRIVRRPPFVGLGWSDLTGRRTPRWFFAGESAWSVFLIINNESGTKNRYLGDERGHGLFDMVQAAVLALNGFTLIDVNGNAAGSCSVTRAANAFAEGWSKESIAMAAVDVTVTTAMDVGTGLVGTEATPDLLGEIAAAWVFSDPLNPGGQLGSFNDVTLLGASQAT